MSKKGKRLREFEKNNRQFNVSDARKQRQERHKEIRQRRELKENDIEKNPAAEKHRRKKNKITNVRRFITGVIILIVITSVGVSAVKMIKLINERNRLLETNQKLIEMKEDLTEEMNQVDSAEYMEQQARKELKMIKNGEILFIVSDEQDEKSKQ